MTDETIAPAAEPAPKTRGWPKGNARSPRLASPERPAQRAPQRIAAYSGRRTPAGRISMSDDPYFIDLSTVPEGMSLRWVRKNYAGKEDRMNLVNASMNGYEAVDGSDFPQYGVESGEIELNGLVLMARPQEMTDEARAEEHARARGQVADHLRGLEDAPPDSMPRRNKDKSMVRVSRGEPIPVRGDAD